MGADFSDVSVHTGQKADAAAKSINAEAYTMGSDIAFGKGNYNPQSASGQKLLAHKLTHVAQQSRPSANRVTNRFRVVSNRPSGVGYGDPDRNRRFDARRAKIRGVRGNNQVVRPRASGR